MEEFITKKSLIMGFIVALSSFGIFSIYLFEMRTRFKNLIKSLQNLQEHIQVSESIALDNLKKEPYAAVLCSFRDLVLVPIYMAYDFVDMFSSSKKRHENTIKLLQRTNFPLYMNTAIERYLKSVESAWEFTTVNKIISCSEHPKAIQAIVKELIHPDTQQKIRHWKAPAEAG